MNRKRLPFRTPAWLMLSAVVVSGCVGNTGSFCTVVRAPIEFAPETSAEVVRTDRPAAEQIAAQNQFWRDNC